ncbi:hypothetical protein [Halomicronema sp. CCY15110]|nr:hypothetical protein [Halomicronema sp. CCY15110]
MGRSGVSDRDLLVWDDSCHVGGLIFVITGNRGEIALKMIFSVE